MALRVDVLANDGSPIGVSVSSIYGDAGHVGVGGAELGLLTLCEGWHNAGHQVRLYNNPTCGTSPFPQYNLNEFNPQDDRDILLIFRSPNERINNANGMKVWFSCDQYTVGNFKTFAPRVDKIVTISPCHAQYFQTAYGIENTITIDLPVRTWEYAEKIEKIPHRLIFCSVPDRGLGILADVYDNIVKAVPDVSLVITSDYRLWGADGAFNESFVSKFLGKSGVRFLGAIPRIEMVKEQLQAQIHAYSCNYSELFCYAVAECSIAGAYPITSNEGALGSTNMGTLLDGSILQDPSWKKRFTDTVIEYLVDPMLETKQRLLQQKALERFSLDKILQEWETKVFNG